MKTILFLIGIALSFITYSQNIDELYIDKESHLILTDTVDIGNYNKDHITAYILNQENLKRIKKLSSNDTLLRFSFITRKLYRKTLFSGYTVDMWIQIRIVYISSKLIIQFYDYGNVYMKGLYTGNSSEAIKGHEYFCDVYFDKEGNVLKGYENILRIKEENILILNKIKQFIK